LLFLAIDQQCRGILKNNWRVICLVLLVALCWRVPFDGHFFYGLEYEDSYVYAVAGRDLSAGAHFCDQSSSCYLTTVCAVGSTNSCKFSETFSGHFIGYPFMVALVSRFFGYTPEVASYLSLVASLITVVVVFVVSALIYPGRVAREAGSLVFSLTPAFVVYGVGTYAEPVSGALVVTCLLLCLRLLNPTGEESLPGIFLNWSALTLTALLALVVKRENVLLVPVLVSTGLILRSMSTMKINRSRWPHYLLLLATICICAEFSLRQLQILRIIQSEKGEYSVFPFSLAILRAMLPLFLKSYVSSSWYLGSGVFVLLGVIASIKSQMRGIYVVTLLAMYLSLYTSHVRSYYQLQGIAATEFDTVRYSVNLGGLGSIIAGVGFAYLIEVLSKTRIQKHLKRFSAIFLWLLIGTYALSSWVLSSRMKEDMLTNELAVRIQPAQAAADAATSLGLQNTFVITQEPLLIQMLSSQPVNVIQFGYLDEALVEDLQKQKPNLVFLYLEQEIYTSEADRKRYRESFAYLQGLQKDLLSQGEGYAVYRLRVPPIASSKL